MLWCSHWKGTPHDCIDHIRLRHHVRGSLSENRQFGAVVPAVNSDVNSLEWGHLSKLDLVSGCYGPFGCPVGFVCKMYVNCVA